MAIREKIPHKAIAAVSAASGLFGAYLLGEMYREQHHFRVTRYEVRTGGQHKAESAPLRVVFLSDLHNHVYGKNNEPLLQAVRDENPDLILIGGDMLTAGENYSEPYDPAITFVGQLPEIAPVYYACGNHEQRLKEYPEKYPQSFAEYKRVLQEKGVVFLENETAFLTLNGRRLAIAGLEIPLYGFRKFRKIALNAETVRNCLYGSSPDSGFPDIAEDKGKNKRQPYRILLAHNPVYMHAYTCIDADLVLCGHLHGGIARLPGIGGVFSPQTFFFPKYSGEMTQEEDRTIVVSKGLGAHSIKLRLWNTPEVVSVSIS